MINLSSSSDQIIQEVWEEYDKACYWHEKVHGKKTVHRQILDSYRRCVEKTHSMLSGFSSEYTSPSGNRWLIFDVIFPKDKVSNAFDIKLAAFIFWETAASAGCFLPIDECTAEGHKKVVHIYSSHFFQRYCERLGVSYKSKTMLINFASDVLRITYDMITDQHGKHEVHRIPHCGMGMAVRRKDNPNVVEIKTFLADDNLAPNKMRKLKDLAEKGDSLKGKSSHDVVETVKINY